MSQSDLGRLARSAFEDVYRDFSTALEARGFSKSKPRTWIRTTPGSIDVILLERAGSTYGAPVGKRLDIRLHSASREPGATTDALALNGPWSDVGRTRGNYQLRFMIESRDGYDRCLNDLVRFVDDECQPWFDGLHESLASGEQSALSDETCKVLGITR